MLSRRAFLLRFSAIAPGKGTARSGFHGSVVLSRLVSAPSPRGRGLQVARVELCCVLDRRFSAIAPGKGTARLVTDKQVNTDESFSAIAPGKGTARLLG